MLLKTLRLLRINKVPDATEKKVCLSASLNDSGSFITDSVENLFDMLREDFVCMLEGGEGDVMTIKTVEMTQEEFDNLPEFDGW